jgi:hypothetical protein
MNKHFMPILVAITAWTSGYAWVSGNYVVAAITLVLTGSFIGMIDKVEL